MASPQPSLRRQLLLLVSMTMAPLLVFGFAVVLWLSNFHEMAARRTLAATSRALSLTLEQQVDIWRAVLTSLSLSPTLESGDYASLYKQASALTDRYGGWIVLSFPSGKQVLNTLAPFGIELPPTHPAALLPSILNDEPESVSDLFVAPVAGRAVLALTVSVAREGPVTHALHFGLFPEQLSEVLARQDLPSGWIGGVVDGQNRLIARAPYLPDVIGEPAPQWLPRADAAPAGHMIKGMARDGTPVFGEFVRLSNAPWTLTLAVPQREFAQVRDHSLILLAMGGTVLIAAILLVFFLFASRVTRPMASLAAAARAATREEPLPRVPEVHIQEISSLRQAVIDLSQKQILLREANHRIKNSLQLVSSILGRQSRATADIEAQAVFREAQAHIQAIARLHERLYREEQHGTVDAITLIRAICGDIAAISAPYATVRVDSEGAARINGNAAGPCALIIAELVTNAIKHASGPKGTVNVRCRVEDGPALIVTVSDSGPGLPPDFDLTAQTGLGLRMSLALASQISGTLRTIPSAGGAVFELRVAAKPPKMP